MKVRIFGLGSLRFQKHDFPFSQHCQNDPHMNLNFHFPTIKHNVVVNATCRFLFSESSDLGLKAIRFRVVVLTPGACFRK